METSRPARTDDLPRLVELGRSGADELTALRGGSLYGRREGAGGIERPALAAALSDPACTVQVGSIGGAVVGFGVGRSEELTGGGRLGRVEALYVEPGARSVGVGEAIMHAMTTWFEAQGCDGVDAMALPGHRATKSFFEGAGFKARLIVMHKHLGGGEGARG
ncbi:MAG: GNAT family N-acetyltransferase [Acidimicrobiales bacterium]